MTFFSPTQMLDFRLKNAGSCATMPLRSATTSLRFFSNRSWFALVLRPGLIAGGRLPPIPLAGERMKSTSGGNPAMLAFPVASGCSSYPCLRFIVPQEVEPTDAPLSLNVAHAFYRWRSTVCAQLRYGDTLDHHREPRESISLEQRSGQAGSVSSATWWSIS
jgi:hypothetical protein